MKSKASLILVLFAVFFSPSCFSQKKNQLSPIEKKGSLYEVRVGRAIMKINPDVGGRITGLLYDGKDFLTDSTINNFNYGATFWISPQSDWDWPPATEIDNRPYTIERRGNELILTSSPDEKIGLIVKKRFGVNKARGSFTIEYTISNSSSSDQKVAPWEVTRVHIGGMAFFPKGDGTIRGGLLPMVTEQNGIVWFKYDSSKLPSKGDRQIYMDGREGWMAEVNGRMLLIQKSPDISVEETAPKEGEMELYASPLKNGEGYVEIEHQGKYETLKPGASASWNVEWYLRKLPDSIAVLPGSISLASYVRKVAR